MIWKNDFFLVVNRCSCIQLPGGLRHNVSTTTATTTKPLCWLFAWKTASDQAVNLIELNDQNYFSSLMLFPCGFIASIDHFVKVVVLCRLMNSHISCNANRQIRFWGSWVLALELSTRTVQKRSSYWLYEIDPIHRKQKKTNLQILCCSTKQKNF